MFKNVVIHQEMLNNIISDSWREKDWSLSVVVDAAEAMEQTDWKWWKEGKVDEAALQIKLIDLMHSIISYGLSNVFFNGDYINNMNLMLQEEWELANNELNQNRHVQLGTTKKLKEIIAIATNSKSEEHNKLNHMLYWLFSVFVEHDINVDEIIRLYMVKNAMNEYRYTNSLHRKNTSLFDVKAQNSNSIYFSIASDDFDYSGVGIRGLILNKIKNELQGA